MRPLPTFSLQPSAKDQLDRIGQEFLAEFLERAVRSQPTNLPALAELAHVLTRLGRLEEGLDVDRQLLRLAPENPTVHYNLACSLALLTRIDDALAALEQAVECGYDDPDHLVNDEDLASLRGEVRFQRVLRRLRAADLPA